jgi:hypothetical protein
MSGRVSGGHSHGNCFGLVHRSAQILKKHKLGKAAQTFYRNTRLLSECEILAPLRLAEITQECNELVAILTTIVKNTRSES